MKPILVIAAVPLEIELLEHALGHSGRISSGGFDYLEGTLGNLELAVCAAGAGKINAAAVTAAMIERYHPQLVINTGCAGAYPGNGLDIGNLVVASEELLVDEGVVVHNGWQDLSYMRLPAVDYAGRHCYNTVPLSRRAAEKAMQLADNYGVSLTRGRFATVSTCSGTTLQGVAISRRWNAIVENMEGAAVAQVCLRYGVDCLEIRGISNQVEERDLKTWNIPAAVEAAQRFVLKYLEEMDRPDLSMIPQAVPEI
jgi:futalosine hydrolase